MALPINVWLVVYDQSIYFLDVSRLSEGFKTALEAGHKDFTWMMEHFDFTTGQEVQYQHGDNSIVNEAMDELLIANEAYLEERNIREGTPVIVDQTFVF